MRLAHFLAPVILSVPVIGLAAPVTFVFGGTITQTEDANTGATSNAGIRFDGRYTIDVSNAQEITSGDPGDPPYLSSSSLITSWSVRYGGQTYSKSLFDTGPPIDQRAYASSEYRIILLQQDSSSALDNGDEVVFRKLLIIGLQGGSSTGQLDTPDVAGATDSIFGLTDLSTTYSYVCDTCGDEQQITSAGFDTSGTLNYWRALAGPSDIPEPGSLALVGLAAAGLAAVRRRKPS